MCRGATLDSVGAARADAQVRPHTKVSAPDSQGYFGPDYWRLPLPALPEECWVACECETLSAPPAAESNNDYGPGYWRLPLSQLLEVVTGHGAYLNVVRWMASGNTACSVQTPPKMCVSDVKAQVLEQAKVPIQEQRFFANRRELNCEENVPQMIESQIELVPSVTDPRISNLGHFRCSATGFDSLNSSSFTLVKRVSGGNNGDIFKYRWRQGQDETCVAVKKLRNRALQQHENTETDEWCIHTNPRKFLSLSNEDALAEIGVLEYLSKQQDLPLYLLKMHGVYQDKLFTWLVTEFAEGGELFEVAASGNIGEKQIQTYSWQMMQACDYLHRHHIGHRDISLENVLLKDGNVRLMDFGMAVCSHSSSGTPLRFFREVGKCFYRAPECYVPTHEEAEVTAPLESRPGDVIMARVHPNFLCEVRLKDSMVPGQTGLADVWGYGALPADVFALGICMFIMAFECPAWETARLSNRFFALYYKNEGGGLESLRQQFGKGKVLSPEAMEMLSDMLHVDPKKRPSASACLGHPWFAELANKTQ